jgi:hypothetical protein
MHCYKRILQYVQTVYAKMLKGLTTHFGFYVGFMVLQ